MSALFQKKRNLILAAGTALAVLFLLIVIIASRSHSAAASIDTTELDAGKAHLEALEARDPGEVDQIIKENRLQKLQEMREERLRQLETGEISVWSLFDDYALLGDSRAVGYSFYDFLPDERVFATAGATIDKVSELLPQVVALNPSNIFMIYGINDICCGKWHDGETYAKDYADVVSQIHQQLPDANVYISSMLPAHSAAFQQYDIDGFNKAVKAMCDQTPNCYYVDNTDISEEYSDMWEPDGIHVQKPFYPHWAVNLIMAVYNTALGDGSDSTESADSSPVEDTAGSPS